MNVVSIDVCGFYISLYGCYRVLGESPFFLSIVSMAGVLCTMVSCSISLKNTLTAHLIPPME